MNFQRILLTAFVVVLMSCQENSVTTVDEKLVNLYTDLLILNEEYKLPTSTLSPEQYQKRIQEVLKNYNTTREAFTARIQTLSNDQAAFQQFFGAVTKKLQDRKSEN